MTFEKFSNYFEKLDSTPKRLELIDILSQLFYESKSGEVGNICYLIQGRVAPFFEPTEIGMAEKMVAESIGKAYEKSKEDVLNLFRTKGDMGKAAQHLAQNSKIKKLNSKLSINDVHSELLKIANLSGEGSVEKKVSTLLSKLDPISVKHVVNIPLGTLRLGIGDPTVMDALSLSKTGKKDSRKLIEGAYNKTSDLGVIAEQFWAKGEKGLKNVHLQVGNPVRPALAERLPNADEVIKRVGNHFAAEPKFDGFRVQIHKRGKKVEIFSRNLEDMTHAFPDIVEGVLGEVKAKSVIMEGEAIAYNPQTEEFLPFQETTKRRRKHNVSEKAKELPLVVFAFDLLFLNGRDITDKPYTERRKLLEGIVSKNNLTVRIADERKLSTSKQILDYFNEAISEGLEGIMIKKLDSPYEAGGRGFHWIKFKRGHSGELTDTVDCVLLGIYAGKGKRVEFGVGGLLVGVYDKKKDEYQTLCRIGTGLKDEEFRKINEIGKKLKLSKKPSRVITNIEPSYWVEPKVVLEVFADEITKSPIHTAGEKDGVGYALRFPRVVKFREDKEAEDSTSVDEIIKMYKHQYVKKK